MAILKLSLIIFFIAVHVDYGVAKEVTQLAYWRSKLPGVPMPRPLLESLPKPAKGKQGGRVAYDFNEDKYDAAAKREKLDSGISLFFLRDELLQGKTVTMDLVYHLEKCKTDASFPYDAPAFSSKNLQQLLQHYSVSPGSTQADLINSTLHGCENPSPKAGDGPHHFCAASLEGFADSLAAAAAGTEVRPVYPARWPSYPLDTYRFVGFRQLAVQKPFLACHKLSFPYAVFRCHQPLSSELYSVTLARKTDGARPQLYAVCHTDTAHWNPRHPAFLLLRGAKPGDNVCHFLQLSDMAWVPAN